MVQVVHLHCLPAQYVAVCLSLECNCTFYAKHHTSQHIQKGFQSSIFLSRNVVNFNDVIKVPYVMEHSILVINHWVYLYQVVH